MVETPQGLLLLDKPSGVTSFDCVHAVKRKLGVSRVGHCGTLDPLARGLLLLLVGPATRRQDSFLGLEKEYWFRGELGRKTSTGDLEGHVIEEKPASHVRREDLERVLLGMLGESSQLPPMYSALKYKGKHYYDYARQGLVIPRVPRTVTLYFFDLLTFAPPFWEATVRCSRGTYVRTLVEDTAEQLGTCGTLVELTRERIGPYRRAHAVSWQELSLMKPQDLIPLLIPLGSESTLSHV